MITLSQRRNVAVDFEPEPLARELTAAELDHVAGGLLPAIVVVVIVAAAVQEVENASRSNDSESDNDGGEG